MGPWIIPWSLLWFFSGMFSWARLQKAYELKCARASKVGIFFFTAQTHHRTRDSTQTLWTRLACRSLGSNGSCFTWRALTARLTLCVVIKNKGYQRKKSEEDAESVCKLGFVCSAKHQPHRWIDVTSALFLINCKNVTFSLYDTGRMFATL